MPTEKRANFRLVDDSDEAWRKYGRDDPYFGVLTDDKFRKENLNPQSLKEFFDSGESHVRLVLDTLRSHVVAQLPMNHVMDFGCGVGRLVVPLAGRFTTVTGIDISEAYREEAQRNCERRGIANVTFAETVTSLMASGPQFDLIHSSIVFNHIAWERGKIIIGQMCALLRPGGALALQVMLSCHRTPLRRTASWLRRNFAPLNWVINVLRGRRIFEPLMQGNEYPLDKLLPLLATAGMGAFYVRLDATPEGHVFAFLFSAKESPPLPGVPQPQV